MRTSHLRKAKKVTEHTGGTFGAECPIIYSVGLGFCAKCYIVSHHQLFLKQALMFWIISKQMEKIIELLNDMRWSYVKVHLVPHIQFQTSRKTVQMMRLKKEKLKMKTQVMQRLVIGKRYGFTVKNCLLCFYLRLKDLVSCVLPLALTIRLSEGAPYPWGFYCLFF